MTKCGWMAVASRQFDSSTPKFSSIISERSQPGGQGDRRASLGRKLLGLGPRHADHGGLRQVVEQRYSVVVLVVLGGSIRHLDYQTALVLDEEWQCEVAGDDVRVYGEPQHPKASLQGVLPHRHVPLEEALRTPHVVDQHVQTACSSSMRPTRVRTCSGSRWSTRTAMPRPPARSTSSAVSSIVSGRSYSERSSRVDRPVTYTVAPAAPSSTAIPRPAPRVPPATRATFPFNFGTIGPSFRSRQRHTRYIRIGLSTATYFRRKKHWTIR